MYAQERRVFFWQRVAQLSNCYPLLGRRPWGWHEALSLADTCPVKLIATNMVDNAALAMSHGYKRILYNPDSKSIVPVVKIIHECAHFKLRHQALAWTNRPAVDKFVAEVEADDFVLLTLIPSSGIEWLPNYTIERIYAEYCQDWRLGNVAARKMITRRIALHLEHADAAGVHVRNHTQLARVVANEGRQRTPDIGLR